MNYHLLTGEQLGEELTFLPGEIRENIRNGRGWLMVGEEEKTDKIGTDEKTEAEEGRILTMAAFQLKPEERGCVELAYIYTVPEAREEGCAIASYTRQSGSWETAVCRRSCVCRWENGRRS